MCGSSYQDINLKIAKNSQALHFQFREDKQWKLQQVTVGGLECLIQVFLTCVYYSSTYKAPLSQLVLCTHWRLSLIILVY